MNKQATNLVLDEASGEYIQQNDNHINRVPATLVHEFDFDTFVNDNHEQLTSLYADFIEEAGQFVSFQQFRTDVFNTTDRTQYPDIVWNIYLGD